MSPFFAGLIFIVIILFIVMFVGGKKTSADKYKNKIEIIISEDVEETLASMLKELLENGKKIDAIKLYREETGADLKEAKEIIESFMIVRGEE